MNFRTIAIAAVAAPMILSGSQASASPVIIDGSAINCSVGIFSVGLGNFQNGKIPVVTPEGIFPWGNSGVSDLVEAVDSYALNCPYAHIHIAGYTYGDFDANRAVREVSEKPYANRVTFTVDEYV